MSQKKSKFVYKAPGESPPNEAEEISEDSDDSKSNEDLETSLLAFDKEQADMIRHINKMGSIATKSGTLAQNQSMQFLSNSLSPNSEKRRTHVERN